MIDSKQQSQMLNRLSRIEGQVRGLKKLIAEPQPDCLKVAQQMAAARKALDKASHKLIACVIEQEMELARGGKATTQTDISEIISKYA